MSDAERLGFVTADQQSRLPASVVERFKQDNIPEAGVGSVGFPKFVVLDADESAADVPDGTFIARLPA